VISYWIERSCIPDSGRQSQFINCKECPSGTPKWDNKSAIAATNCSYSAGNRLGINLITVDPKFARKITANLIAGKCDMMPLFIPGIVFICRKDHPCFATIKKRYSRLGGIAMGYRYLDFPGSTLHLVKNIRNACSRDFKPKLPSEWGWRSPNDVVIRRIRIRPSTVTNHAFGCVLWIQHQEVLIAFR
jgi:hypothetical protein